MKKKRKWLILMVLPVLLFIVVCLKGQTMLGELKTELPARIEAEIGLPVTIGRIEAGSFSSIKIKEAVLKDGATEILRAPEIIIEISLWQALKASSPLAGIKSVELQKPDFFLRQMPDGSWNIEKLRKKESAAKSEFGGKIKFEEATLHLESKVRRHEFNGVNGEVDCSEFPRVKIDCKGLLDGSEVFLAGDYQNDGRSALTLSVKNFDLGKYVPYLPEKFAELRSIDGRVNDFDLIVNGEKGRWKFAGEAQLKEGSLKTKQYSISDANARLIFTEHSVYAVGSLKLMEQLMRVNAQGDWASGKLILQGDVSARQFDLAQVMPQIQLGGKADFDLKIGGSADSPKIAGAIRLKEGKWQEYAFQEFSAEGVFNDGALRIEKFALDLMGGRVEGGGRLESDSEKYEAHLKANDLSLTQLTSGIVGRWQLDAVISGQGFTKAPQVRGQANMTGGSLQGFAVEGVTALFRTDFDGVNVDSLLIRLGEGSLSGKGTIRQNRLDLAVAGSRLPMERLTPQISGEGSFSGKLQGELPAWRLSGTAALHDGLAFQQPYATAQGVLELDNGGVLLKDWRIRNKQTEHTVSGFVSYRTDGPIELEIKSRRARAEDVVRLLLPGEELTGNIDNELLLGGTLDDLRASGRVKLSDGSFRGRLLAKAEGSYNIIDKELYLNGLKIDSLNTRIEVSGKAVRGDGLDLTVSADDIDFARLPFTYPYPVSGKGRFNGRITGSDMQPVLSGVFQAESLLLDKEVIRKIRADVRLTGQELEISDASFLHGEGQGVFRGGIDFAGQDVYGLLNARNLTLEKVLPIFQLPDQGLHGRLSGELRVAGKMNRPDAWLNGYLIDGSIKAYPLDRIELDLAFENNVLKVNQFKAQQGKGTLLAQGNVDLDGDINLEVGGQDIDAGIITALSGCDWDLDGRLRFAAQVGGTVKEPKAAASLEISDGGVKTATFDSLYGLFILENNNIQVNQILLRKDKYRASAYGDIPLTALTPEGRQAGNGKTEMDLRCRLDNANLSILPILAPQFVEWGEGETQGELNISGTLQAPDFKGRLAIRSGRLKLNGIKDPLENIMIDATMEKDTLVFNKLSAQVGKGSVSLDGTMRVKDWKWHDYDLSLKMDSPSIRHRYFDGPVRGELTLRPGKNGLPRLAGDVILENDTITVPVVPEFAASDIDMELDLNVIAGNKVRAYNPILYDFFSRGRLHFGGSLKEPVSSGKIRVVNGTITYLSTTFKIIEGVADFNRSLMFEPVISLLAQARLPQWSVNLMLSGPVREMAMTLTSDPPMTQTQILAILNAGGSLDSRDRGGFDEVAGIINAGLHARFLSQFEGRIRNAFGLDQFRIVKGAKGEVLRKTYWEKEGALNNNREVYNLQLGKYLNDRLYLGCSVALGEQAYEATLRYDLSRRISIVAASDDQKRSWLGFEARFKF